MKRIRHLLLFLAVLSCSCGYAQTTDHLLWMLSAEDGTAIRLTCSFKRDILNSKSYTKLSIYDGEDREPVWGADAAVFL